MCLHSSTSTASIAKEDIYCYKILLFNKYANANEIYFYTPIAKKVIPKIPYTINDKKVKEKIFRYYNGITEVSCGFVHAYLSTAHSLYYENAVYIECIIPKGTRYFVGMDNSDDICAKKIKLLRVMLKEEINPINRYTPDYYPLLPLYMYNNKTIWSEIKNKIINFFK